MTAAAPSGSATPYQLPNAASAGFQDAAAYDAYRPSYPAEAVSALLEQLGLAGHMRARVVEIAAGTGKFTELLAKRGEAFDVVAVEPHAGMRAQLEAKKLQGPGTVKVVDGHAASLPVEAEWGDGCIAAQSFHWFATEEALGEIQRVLRPNGVFGMIWNVEEYNAPKSWKFTTLWEQKLNDWIWSIGTDGHPRYRDELWRNVFEKQAKSVSTFSLPLDEHVVHWTVWLSEDALWARINTLSQVAIMEGKQREAAVETFREAMQMGDVERNGKGEVALHGRTCLAWTTKL